MSLLLLLLLATASGDPTAPGRAALHDLEYERALRLLMPVAEDNRVAKEKRAEAFVLIAQAHFGIAEPDAENRVRSAFRSAFRLDRDVVLVDRNDLSPKLVAVFDEMRDKLGPPKRRGVDDEPQKRRPEPQPQPQPEPEPAPKLVREPEPSPPPPPTPAPPEDGPSLVPWLVVGGAGGAVGVVGVVGAVAAESWLAAIPPEAKAADVQQTQTLGRVGVAAAVVGAGAVVVAGVGAAAALAAE